MAPSILLVDDGELDRVQGLLERMRVDWVRCVEPESGFPLEKPTDLLITSGPRAMKMPPLCGDRSPTWLCVYDQDFLPLRERLRDLGIHYLVSGEVTPRTFELFLRQLLHAGEERRQVRRIPLRCEIEIKSGLDRRKGLLLELSLHGCVFATEEELPRTRRTVVRLPMELAGDEEIELPGEVLRAAGTSVPGRLRVTTVLRFRALEALAMAAIDRILSGQTLGTQVTPLCAEGGDEPIEDEADWLERGNAFPGEEPPAPPERRGAARVRYTRCVDGVRWLGDPEPRVLFARDLSVSGMRISSVRPPAVGSEIAVALYGAAHEEPVLVVATVVRVEGTEVGLRFDGLGPAERRALERLVAAAPRLEALAASGPLFVAERID